MPVCLSEDLPPGAVRFVSAAGVRIGVFNCMGDYFAIEDRCTHDDGPLAHGAFDPERRTVECPRHGSIFDLETGKPKTLPAYLPAETFDAFERDGEIVIEVDE